MFVHFLDKWTDYFFAGLCIEFHGEPHTLALDGGDEFHFAFSFGVWSSQGIGACFAIRALNSFSSRVWIAAHHLACFWVSTWNHRPLVSNTSKPPFFGTGAMMQALYWVGTVMGWVFI
jgi:hypothetical protein